METISAPSVASVLPCVSLSVWPSPAARIVMVNVHRALSSFVRRTNGYWCCSLIKIIRLSDRSDHQTWALLRIACSYRLSPAALPETPELALAAWLVKKNGLPSVWSDCVCPGGATARELVTARDGVCCERTQLDRRRNDPTVKSFRCNSSIIFTSLPINFPIAVCHVACSSIARARVSDLCVIAYS